MQTNLSKRLYAAASFVREGAFVADIGTDHAYLPIYLVSRGRARGAVASDINRGPYLCAKKNIEENSLSDRIATLCVGGLEGIDAYAPDDILICGMGGELIAKIIDEARWTRDGHIRLVLQPMTHSEILRKYLFDNGFTIIDEAIVLEDKLYEVICAEYTGIAESYSEIELLLGRINIEKATDELYMLIARHIDILKKIQKGKLSGGGDASAESHTITLLEELRNDRK